MWAPTKASTVIGSLFIMSRCWGWGSGSAARWAAIAVPPLDIILSRNPWDNDTGNSAPWFLGSFYLLSASSESSFALAPSRSSRALALVQRSQQHTTSDLLLPTCELPKPCPGCPKHSSVPCISPHLTSNLRLMESIQLSDSSVTRPLPLADAKMWGMFASSLAGSNRSLLR